MPDDNSQKITVGFIGGQSLSARIGPDVLSTLRGALDGGGWYDLAAEDGTVTLDLEKVVYVQVDSEAHRIGFGL